MAKRQYISAISIVGEWLTDSGYTGSVEEDLYLRWVHNATELILGTESLLYNIALLDVHNFVAPLPNNLHSFYLVGCVDNPKQCENREQIVSWAQHVWGTNCQLEVNLKCPKCHEEKCNCGSPTLEFDIDGFYLDERPWLKRINHVKLLTYTTPDTDGFPCISSMPKFQIMKPRVSNDVWWNSEYYHGVCAALGPNLNKSYSFEVSDGKFITDLKEGQVLASYLGYKKDAQGYYMVPNIIEAVEATKAYLTEQVMRREWLNNTGNQNNRLRWLDAQNIRREKFKDAEGILEMPDADKWLQIAQKNWVISRDEYYYDR